ncbi:hypothetical protein PAMP_016989 [Pampus punctatissimus]
MLSGPHKKTMAQPAQSGFNTDHVWGQGIRGTRAPLMSRAGPARTSPADPETDVLKSIYYEMLIPCKQPEEQKEYGFLPEAGKGMGDVASSAIRILKATAYSS